MAVERSKIESERPTRHYDISNYSIGGSPGCETSSDPVLVSISREAESRHFVY